MNQLVYIRKQFNKIVNTSNINDKRLNKLVSK